MLQTRDERLRFPCWLFAKWHDVQFILLIGSRRGRNDRPFAVVRHLRAMPIFGLVRRCVYCLVFRLGRADFVVIDGLVIIQLLECRAFFWFCKTRV